MVSRRRLSFVVLLFSRCFLSSSAIVSAVSLSPASSASSASRRISTRLRGMCGAEVTTTYFDGDTPRVEKGYLYVQDPASVRLIFSIMDDDMIGEGDVIGSAHMKLADIIPQAKLSQEALIQELKEEVLTQIKQNGDFDIDNDLAKVKLGARTWQDWIKMTSKPKKKDKKGQVAMGAAATRTHST